MRALKHAEMLSGIRLMVKVMHAWSSRGVGQQQVVWLLVRSTRSRAGAYTGKEGAAPSRGSE